MSELVFADSGLKSLKEAMLKEAPNEAAAILLAGYHRAEGGTRLTIREQEVVPKESCLTQSPMDVTIQPAFLAAHMKRARNDGLSLVVAHTHPFGDGDVRLSPIDDQAERLLMPSIFGRAPGRPHASVVLGRTGFDGRVWKENAADFETVDYLTEAGSDLTRISRIRDVGQSTSAAHDRSVRALGIEGQQVIGKLTVGIVGLGGIGSLVAQELAHLGIGELLLIDNDVIELSNLNRVVGADESTVGMPKVEVAADLMRRINKNIAVQPHREDIRTSSAGRKVLAADIIVCCTDSHGSRAILNQLAYQYFRPVIDIGVSIEARHGQVQSVVGRVQLLSPGLPCLVCQGLLDPEEVRRDLLSDEERKRDPYIVGVQEPQPAVISVNGTVASLAVTMFLSLATGFPSPARHQLYLAHRGSVRTIESRRAKDCVACSLKGALGRGDSWPLPLREE